METDFPCHSSIAGGRSDSIWVMIGATNHSERTVRMAINAGNSFRTRDKLNVGAQSFEIHRLEFLEKQGLADLAKLPFSLRILLENLLRCEYRPFVPPDHIPPLPNCPPRAP